MAQKFQVTIDIDAEITKLQQKLNSLNSSIGNGSKFGGKYQQDIDQAIQRLDELRKKAASPLTSKSDYGQVVKDIKAVEGELNNLYNRASQAKPIDLLSKDTIKHLDDAQKAVDATTQKTKQLSDAEKEVNKALNAQAAAQDKVNKAQQQNKTVAANNYLKAKDAYVKKFQEIDGGKHASNDITKGNLAAIANGTYTGTSYTKEDLAILQQYAAEMKDCEATMKSLGATAADANGSTRKMFSQTEMNDFTAKLNDANTAVQNAQTNLNNLSTQEAVKQFNDLKLAGQNLGLDMSAYTGVNDIQAMATEVEQAMNKITNSNQGIQSLLNQINQLKQEINQLKAESNKAGKSIDDMTEAQKQMSMVESRAKYFFSFMNGVNLLKRGVKSAISTIKELDQAMTEMAVVTQYDIGDLWNTMPQMTQHAKDLGVAVKDVYEATTLYTQQGIEFNTAVGLSVQTLKMARIAGLDAATATDRLTNAMRAFNMEVNEDSAARVSDIYSAVAARTASNVDELSTAMTKVASLAANVGMTIEQTTAYLATGIETTRESADSIGTALKTVLARFAEMKKDPSMQEAVDGEVVNVNKVEEALRSVGIALRDEQGQFRSMGDVFQELNAKWGTLTNNQQRYIATMAAGSRQQSRFIAMMQDATRTSEIYSIATDSAGKSQEQFEKTVESFQSKVAKLKDTWNEFLMGLANNDIVKGAIDLLTKILDVINKITTIPDAPGLTAFLKLITAFAAFKAGKGILLGLIKGLGTSTGLLSKGTQQMGLFAEGGFALTETLEGLNKKIVAVGGASSLLATKFGILKDNFVYLGIAGKELLSSLAPLLPYIVAIGAAIAAIVITIKLLQAASLEGRIKATRESVDNLNESLDATNDKLQTLSSKSEELKNLEDEFQNLVKGSDEYNKKLQEINDTALDIASQDLSIKTSVDSNGKISVDEDSLKNYQTKLYQQQALQQGAVYLAENQLKTLTNEQTARDLAKELAKENIYNNNGLTYTDQEILNAAKSLEENNNQNIDAMRNIFGEHIDELEKIANVYRENTAIQKETNRRLVESALYDEKYDDATRSIFGNTNLADLNEAKALEEYKAIFTNESSEDVMKILMAGGQATVSGSVRQQMVALAQKYGIDAQASGVFGAGLFGGKITNSKGEVLTEGELGALITAAIEQANVQGQADLFQKTFTQNQREDLANLLTGDADSTLFDKLGANGSVLDLADILHVDYKELTKIFGDNFADTLEETKASIQQTRNEIKSSVIKSVLEFCDSLDLTNSACGALTNEINSLTYASHKALSSGLNSITNGGIKAQQAFWQSFGEGQMTDQYLNSKEYQKFVSELQKLNFNTPIAGASKLKVFLQSDNKQLSTFAQNLIEINDTAFNAGAQISSLLDITQYEDLNKELDKIYKKNKKITSTDIDSIKDQYEDLNTVLETTELSAEKLATAFNLIREESISATVFTNDFVEALNKIVTVEETVSSTHSWIENFKEVSDSGEGIDFLNGFYEKLNDYLHNYEYGNTQVEQYITTVFGKDAWEEILTKTQPEAEVAIKNYFDKINRMTIGDGYGLWKDLALSGKTLNDIAKFALNGDGSIQISLLDGATTADLIQAIVDTQGYTEEVATSLVEKLTTNDFGLKQQLNTNDYIAQINALRESIYMTITDSNNYLQVYTHDQIAYLAEAYNKEYDKIVADIKSKSGDIEVAILDWTQVDFTKTADQIYETFKTALNKANKDITFDEIFNDAISYDEASQGPVLELSKFLELAAQHGLDATQAKSLAEGWVNASDGLLAETVAVYDENLTRTEETITAKTADDLQGAIDKAIENSKIEQVITEISSSLTNTAYEFSKIIIKAFAGIEMETPEGVIKFNVSGALNNIEHAKETANTTTYTAQDRAKISQNFIKNKQQEEKQIKSKQEVAAEQEKIKKKQEEIAAQNTKNQQSSLKNYIDSLYRVSSQNMNEEKNNRATSPDYWKHSFDWLYNLLEHIEVETRRISQLESETNLLISQGYLNEGDLEDAIATNNSRLEKVIHSLGDQMVLAAGKEKEMNLRYNLAKQTRVTGSLANGQSFEETVDFTKYFSIIDNEIKLNEDMVNALITDRDKGEEYAQALTEVINEVKGARDAMIDAEAEVINIRQTIEDERKKGLDKTVSFIDRVANALQAIDEKELAELQKTNDALNKLDEDIVNAMQSNIDKIRQDLTNEETEQDLEAQARRLAYLRQDTTGANQTEIKQLEKSLKQSTKDYQNSLVDQSLNHIQEQNDVAALQRQQQIDMMQAQITWNQEHGIYAEQAQQMIINAYDQNGNFDVYDSGIYNVLYNGEGWLSKSEIQLEGELDDLYSEMSDIGIWLDSWYDQLDQRILTTEEVIDDVRDEIDLEGDETQNILSLGFGAIGDGLDKIATALSTQLGDIKDRLGDLEELYDKEEDNNRREQRQEYNYNNRPPKWTELKWQDGRWLEIPHYKKGGLNTETGPAWLDGTKQKPEIILNPSDSANFMELRDILRSIKQKGYINSDGESGTKVYDFDVDINVASIDTDEKIDQIADKVKTEITSSMNYRNVTSVSLMK